MLHKALSQKEERPKEKHVRSESTVLVKSPRIVFFKPDRVTTEDIQVAGHKKYSRYRRMQIQKVQACVLYQATCKLQGIEILWSL